MFLFNGNLGTPKYKKCSRHFTIKIVVKKASNFRQCNKFLYAKLSFFLQSNFSPLTPLFCLDPGSVLRSNDHSSTSVYNTLQFSGFNKTVYEICSPSLSHIQREVHYCAYNNHWKIIVLKLQIVLIGKSGGTHVLSLIISSDILCSRDEYGNLLWLGVHTYSTHIMTQCLFALIYSQAMTKRSVSMRWYSNNEKGSTKNFNIYIGQSWQSVLWRLWTEPLKHSWRWIMAVKMIFRWTTEIYCVTVYQTAK